jgi:hypothetical protein
MDVARAAGHMDGEKVEIETLDAHDVMRQVLREGAFVPRCGGLSIRDCSQPVSKDRWAESIHPL